MICDSTLYNDAVLDPHLIPKMSSRDPKVFYQQKKTTRFRIMADYSYDAFDKAAISVASLSLTDSPQ